MYLLLLEGHDLLMILWIPTCSRALGNSITSVTREKAIVRKAERIAIIGGHDRVPTNMIPLSIRNEGRAMIKEEKVLKRKKVLRENPTPRIILYINEKTEQMTVVYDFCCEQDFTAFWNRV